MSLDLKESLHGQVVWHWENLFRPRIEGLTDDEYFWEPAPDCWNVRKIEGRWRPDSLPEPDPAPLTTIAWRMSHIGMVLGARASFHFGDRSWRNSDVEWPGSASDAIAFVDRHWDLWRTGVEALRPEQLEQNSEGPPGTLDAQFPFADVILHINREVIHHGAEVGVLRDVWRAKQLEDPVIVAIMRGDRDAIEGLRTQVDDVRARHPELVLRATVNGNEPAVRLLAELGWDVNYATSRAPLHAAAAVGDVAMIKTLVEIGGDLSARDGEFAETPAGWARWFKREDVAVLIDEIGAGTS